MRSRSLAEWAALERLESEQRRAVFAALDTPEKRVAWFNSVEVFHEWHVGDVVWCLHCDRSFLAENVRCDSSGLAECGNAGCNGSPLDFATSPWWRGGDDVH